MLKIGLQLFGGRGSGGGKGGGGGGGASGESTNKAKDANMPELTGTQKQVSWAEDIRSNALSAADSYYKQATDEFGLSMPNGGYVSPEAATMARNNIISTFQKPQAASASFIIDNRAAMSNEAIRRSFINAQLYLNKRK